MAIHVIKPGESLVEKAGELLLAGGAAADSVVVFPGKRPAHFLRRWLAQQKGSALEAPRLLSMDDFIGQAAVDLGIKGTPASSLDLAGLMYARLKEELCGVIARDPGEMGLEAFLPWALKLAGDFEELKIELKTERDLAAYDAILPQDLRTSSFIKKLEGFSRLYGGLYRELEGEGLLTRAMKYAQVAAAAGELAERRPRVIFAGFYALTASEKRIMKALYARGAEVLLEAGPGLEEQFSFLGPVPRVPPAPPPAKLHFYKAPDLHGEVFSLARALKKPGPGDVIVLPEPAALFPLLEHALPPGAEYNVSMGYPLTATPVYALLDALGDLLDRRGEAGYFAPDYLKFVFHPYVKNLKLEGSAEFSRVVFQEAAGRLAERSDKYLKLESVENDAALLEAASGRLADYGLKADAAKVRAHLSAVHRALIKPFEELGTIADFAGRLLDLVSYISANSTAPLHPYWAPFVEKAMESIVEMRGCRLAGERFSSPSGYFKFLKNFLQGASYPFPGTPLKGLQVLGFLETRGLSFDRVYFLDANADVLPAARKEDTVLPHGVREGLGLSTYKAREALARYHFHALAGGAGEVHLFYRDSADKERSPFVEKLAWELERGGGRPAEQEVHLRVAFSQADPAPVAKPAGLAEALRGREFSPSALDTYLACGLRFYHQYALRLREKDEISGEIEQRDIGTIVHDVLERFFKARLGRPLVIAEKDYGELRDAARAVFDEKLKGHNAGFEYLIKRQVERRLADILDYHRDELAGVTVLACETELKTGLPTRFGTVRLKGRADRIDSRGGTVHVVDYKTGTTAAVPNWQKFDPADRAAWPSTLKSVQLPFYVLAYMGANGIASPAGLDASLMLLGAENINEETLYRERNRKAPDKAAVFAGYKAAITALLEEILDPALPFRPAADEAECEGCPFRGLCGRQWVE